MCWWSSCVYWAINNANSSLRHWDINNNKWNYIKCDKCISKSNLRKKGFSRRGWNFRCLLNWKKSKQKNYQMPPTHSVNCIVTTDVLRHFSTLRNTIHWPCTRIYSPVCKPTKPEVIWDHRLRMTFRKKKKCLQYKQVNICWKFQQWIKTTPQMPNWEITHRCLYLFLGVIKNNDKKVCISCPIWVSINIKDTFKLIFNVKPVLKTM